MLNPFTYLRAAARNAVVAGITDALSLVAEGQSDRDDAATRLTSLPPVADLLPAPPADAVPVGPSSTKSSRREGR